MARAGGVDVAVAVADCASEVSATVSAPTPSAIDVSAAAAVESRTDVSIGKVTGSVAVGMFWATNAEVGLPSFGAEMKLSEPGNLDAWGRRSVPNAAARAISKSSPESRKAQPARDSFCEAGITFGIGCNDHSPAR